MTETKTPAPTPSPTPGVSSKPAANAAQRSQFMAALLGMSWQLALVVLVPILGGFFLDQQFATSPLLVVFGFIIASAGFGWIVREQMLRYSPPEVVQSAKAANSAPTQTIQPDNQQSKGAQ